MSNPEFIEKLKNGDEESFKILVNENSNKILNVCYGFVRDEEDANDLAQEVFIEVFHSVKNFRSESSLSTWLYRIAVNKCINFIKMKSRKKRSGIILSLFKNESNEFEIPDKETPEDIHIRNERIQILRKAMDSLPEEQRIALNLSSIELFSYEEISKIMKKSISAIESLIFRGKKSLRIKLKKFYEKNK